MDYYWKFFYINELGNLIQKKFKLTKGNKSNILVSSISNNDHDRSRETDNKYRPSFEKVMRTTVN
jgi:hypothetical protein